LTLGQVLAWSGLFYTSLSLRVLVFIGVQVVVMHMLGVVFSVSGVLLSVESTVTNVEPSSFGFVSQQNVSTVVPLEPSPKLLG